MTKARHPRLRYICLILVMCIDSLINSQQLASSLKNHAFNIKKLFVRDLAIK